MSETPTAIDKKRTQQPKVDKQDESTEALQKQGDDSDKGTPGEGDVQEDAKADSKEEAKVVKDPTAKFIESKPELARYAMAQTFREFIVKNYARFDGFKSEKNYNEAFSEFWGVKK